jgi:hypothetical protein
MGPDRVDATVLRTQISPTLGSTAQRGDDPYSGRLRLVGEHRMTTSAIWMKSWSDIPSGSDPQT